MRGPLFGVILQFAIMGTWILFGTFSLIIGKMILLEANES